MGEKIVKLNNKYNYLLDYPKSLAIIQESRFKKNWFFILSKNKSNMHRPYTQVSDLVDQF